MSSRLDGSLVTVVTGQAVETFDRLFRDLYANSSPVDLRQVAVEPEPEAEPEKDPLPLPAALAPSAMAMKLYSPKYALALCSAISSPPPAAGQDGGGEIPKDPEDPKKKRRRAAAKEEPPPLPPSLSSLEKVCLIAFLPTWPEPDPPSDVIGFINIRDLSKPVQAHLQRSEMFEASRVIRFSSPISIPAEVLPEVAKPRQLAAPQDGVRKLSRGQSAAGEGRHARPRDLRSPERNTPSWEMQPGSVRKQDVSSPSQASNGEGLRPTTVQTSTPPGSDANVGDGHLMTRTQSSPRAGESVHASKGVTSSSPTCAWPSSWSSPPLRSPNPALPPSGSSSPPVPKPRTVQLVIEDAVRGGGQKQQVVRMVGGQQTGAGPRVQDEPAAQVDLYPPKESRDLQSCADPVREGKIGEAQDDKVLGDSQETLIQEVVKEKPKSKQASESGGLSAAVTERGGTGFGCQEVTRANRKSAEKPETGLPGGHALQEMPQTAPIEGFAPALDQTDALASASSPAHAAALDPPTTSEPSSASHAGTCSLDVPPRKGSRLGAPDPELPPPSPPGGTPSTPNISDECASSRTLSTTSEEYYECSDVPFNEALEGTGVHVHGRGVREEDAADSANISARAGAAGTTEGNAAALAEPASLLALSLPDHGVRTVEDERNGRESSTRRGEKMAARHEPPLSPLDDKMLKLKEKERNPTSGPVKNGNLPPDESRKSPSKAARRDDVGVTSGSKVAARNDKREAIRERSKRGVVKETEEQKVSVAPACYLSS